MSARGYLAIVLHAHLPFVRHPEHGDFLEERWLFEAITETYVPLLDALRALARDRVPHRLALSLSPSLLNMLVDPLLQGRYLRHLEALIEFAEEEVERTRSDARMQRLAHFYRELLRRTRRTFIEVYGSNLVAAFRGFQDAGTLEILACAATHGYLPLLRGSDAAVRAQVVVGVEEYRRFFGRSPSGMWLPECGYYPGLDDVLARHGVRWTILEAHGLLHARPRPLLATFAPVIARGGIAAFGRDAESSRQVWSASEGYPGDYDYRDFYRDAGFDLDYEIVRPLLPPSGDRVATGFKYHRITGPGSQKDLYDLDWAAAKVDAHAKNFVGERARQLHDVADTTGRPPIAVAPYDAELFGHWWFEGPQWLETVIRQAAYDQDAFALVTPGEYLDEHPVAQACEPAASSWGQHGYSAVWLSGENDWIYRHLQLAAERMSDLARRHADARGLELRALNQSARELLLAQSSDWAFIMSRGTVVEYAVQRTRTHLGRLRKLHEDLEAGTIDEGWLAMVEAHDNLFPAIDYRIYA
jgi:1,4-alpha-glucan branching enzyme